MRPEQASNIMAVWVTFDVLNIEISRDLSEQQPENICVMFFTLEVSNDVGIAMDSSE